MDSGICAHSTVCTECAVCTVCIVCTECAVCTVCIVCTVCAVCTVGDQTENFLFILQSFSPASSIRIRTRRGLPDTKTYVPRLSPNRAFPR